MLGSPGRTFDPEQRYHRIDPLLTLVYGRVWPRGCRRASGASCLSLTSISPITELLLRYMLGSPGRTFDPEQRYHRIDPLLPKYTELDDVASIPELIEVWG